MVSLDAILPSTEGKLLELNKLNMAFLSMYINIGPASPKKDPFCLTVRGFFFSLSSFDDPNNSSQRHRGPAPAWSRKARGELVCGWNDGIRPRRHRLLGRRHVGGGELPSRTSSGLFARHTHMDAFV